MPGVGNPHTLGGSSAVSVAVLETEESAELLPWRALCSEHASPKEAELSREVQRTVV